VLARQRRRINRCSIPSMNRRRSLLAGKEPVHRSGARSAGLETSHRDIKTTAVYDRFDLQKDSLVITMSEALNTRARPVQRVKKQKESSQGD
jgi:hypothetical protein